MENVTNSLTLIVFLAILDYPDQVFGEGCSDREQS